MDTKDVEKFIESESQRERLGSFTEKPDSELFLVDTEPERCPKKLRREILNSKKPRCFEILENRSAVKDPIKIRNRVRTPDERKDSLVHQKEEERRKRGLLTLKERLAGVNRNLAKANALKKPKRGEYKQDVWKVSSITDKSQASSDWMSAEVVRHTLKGGMPKRRIPASVTRKPSGIDPIKFPHPGESYNPSYQDHQQLLRTIAEKEAEELKKEEHLQRVTSKMFKKIPAEEKQRNILEELSEGLPKFTTPADETGDHTDDTDSEVRSVNPPTKNRKKTLVQRRKQREQKQLMQELRKAKVNKKKISDIYSLRKIQANLNSIERKQAVQRERRILKKKLLRETGPKILSKTKFQPPEPEFKLAEELTGTLRAHEPGGCLLRDRFKSFQERGILAPSQRKLKLERAKVKRFIKPDHKIDVDAYLKSMKNPTA